MTGSYCPPRLRRRIRRLGDLCGRPSCGDSEAGMLVLTCPGDGRYVCRASSDGDSGTRTIPAILSVPHSEWRRLPQTSSSVQHRISFPCRTLSLFAELLVFETLEDVEDRLPGGGTGTTGDGIAPSSI